MATTGGFDFRPPIRRTRVYEGEGSDDDTMSTVSEALTERTEGGDGFFGGNGRLSSLAYNGPSVRQIDVVIRPPGGGGAGGVEVAGAGGTGFGSPVPPPSGSSSSTRDAAAAHLPVIMDDDGNLLLDNLEMQAIAEKSETPEKSLEGEGEGEGEAEARSPGAEEGDSAMSPSIDMWLEKKEEARKAEAAAAAAAAAAAVAREAVASPPGPATPPGDTFKKAGSDESVKVDEDEYDALVREAESLALELDRVAKAEEREAAEDAEARLEEEERKRNVGGGGGAAGGSIGRNGSLTRMADGSDYSSGDDDDVDAAGTPLPFGAAAASPPHASAESRSGIANEVPASPRGDEGTRVAPISPWPWWMVMLGCDGCGSVRPNKQHKYTFEEDEAVNRSVSLAGGTDFMGAVFGSSSSGPAALPPPPPRDDDVNRHD